MSDRAALESRWSADYTWPSWQRDLQFLRHYEQGHTYEQVGAHFAVTRQAALNRCRKAREMRAWWLAYFDEMLVASLDLL